MMFGAWIPVFLRRYVFSFFAVHDAARRFMGLHVATLNGPCF